MPRLSGVKAARAVWRGFPAARIIFWTQFPHEIYINEIRRIVKLVQPPPAYGFIDKNNPESRFLRFVAAVLEDGADMIDPAFKDSFKRPLLTEFEAEALYYLALGLSNWAIARKCSLSLRGVESRLKLTRLPWVKTLDQFDFELQPSIDRRQVRDLAGLSFVERAENVVLLGPPDPAT